jgi:glycine cleavage system H protein
MATSIPDNLKYTKDHEWMRLSGKTATVGITAHAQEQLGDVVYVELPKVGDQVKVGKPFGVVESTKAVSELFSPVDGTVSAVNDALVQTPDAINRDAYEAGWMIRVELAGAPPGDLLDAKGYEKLLADSPH